MITLVFKISKLSLSAIFVGIFLFPLSVNASFSVSPLVINESGVPRDVIGDTVTLVNETDNRRIRIFTFVNNVSEEEGGGIEEFQIKRGLENAESLANWVSVSRQHIELGPGESRDVPVTVNIHKDAKPGKYHALIFFSDGFNSSEAEGKISRDKATLLAIEVKDDSEDILNLRSFVTEDRFFTGSPVEFLVTLDNRGDTTLIPSGELSVYNRKGREIGAVPFNEEGLAIEPEEERDFKVLWKGELDWGKHRARLTVNYGSVGRRYTLNDTLFFTVTPVISLALIFFSLLLVVMFLTHLLHERHKRVAVQDVGVGFRRRVRDDEEQDEHTINLRGQ